MKVGELISKLAAMPQESPVVFKYTVDKTTDAMQPINHVSRSEDGIVELGIWRDKT